MKKILISALCLMILCGCGNNSKDSMSSQDSTYTQEKEIAKSNEQQAYTERNPSWYQSFEIGLKDGNIAYNAKQSLDTYGVNASEGYRYIINDKNVDIYRFDDQSVLERLSKEKTIEIDGEKKNVLVNGNMVIISDEVSQDIIDIFNKIKEEI